MKKTLQVTIVILMCLAFLVGCRKEVVEFEEGSYTGKFTVIYSLDTLGPLSGPTEIEFKDGRYSCVGNLDRIPAGGLGTYAIDSNKITFTDESIWTLNFDGHLILNGEYFLELEKNRIRIFKTFDGLGFYEYSLDKE